MAAELPIRWELRQMPGGYQGTLFIRLEPGTLIPGAGPVATAVAARAPTKKQAIAKAASIAVQALENPVISAMLPPGSALALQGAKKLAQGKLGKVVGPGAKRLAKALGGLFG